MGGKACKFQGKRQGEKVFSLVCGYCYHRQGKKHCISGVFYFYFLVRLAHFKNFRTFHVKAFFLGGGGKEIHHFDSRVILDLEGVLLFTYYCMV